MSINNTPTYGVIDFIDRQGEARTEQGVFFLSNNGRSVLTIDDTKSPPWQRHCRIDQVVRFTPTP